MTDAPEKIWVGPITSWGATQFSLSPDVSGSPGTTEYIRTDLYDAVVAERDELLAGLEEIRCISFAATNPANWQTGDTSDAARLKHYENTLDDIADRNQHITILEDTFRSMIAERDGLLAAEARFKAAFFSRETPND